MGKLLNNIKSNWLKFLPIFFGMVLILWVIGCPPRAPSPLDPSQKRTLPELDLEIRTLIEQYELAALNIEEQEKFRRVIINNALIMAQTGTVDPLGILTGLAALYGFGSAANSTKNVIKKKMLIPKVST